MSTENNNQESMGNVNEENIYKMLYEFRNWNRDWDTFIWDTFMVKKPKSADHFVAMLAKKYEVTPNNKHQREMSKNKDFFNDYVQIKSNIKEKEMKLKQLEEHEKNLVKLAIFVMSAFLTGIATIVGAVYLISFCG